MLFSQCAIAATPSSVTEYAGTVSACSGSGSTVYRLYINVRVCDTTPDGANYHSCKQYGSAYKPEGLIQKYADKLRYSAFGYLNDAAGTRDGGVLRAAMTYVGPTQPVPGSTAITNPAPEWSSATGRMIANPASSDASATATATNESTKPPASAHCPACAAIVAPTSAPSSATANDQRSANPQRTRIVQVKL